MATIPTEPPRWQTRRRLRATIDDLRTEIAGLDRTVAHQASILDVVTAERDDAYQAVGQAEGRAEKLDRALDEVRQLREAMLRAEAARDEAMRAAADAQAVTLKLLEVHHTQGTDSAAAVRTLAKMVGVMIEQKYPSLVLPAPEPPEVLPGGTHAVTAGEPATLVPVDGPVRKRAQR